MRINRGREQALRKQRERESEARLFDGNPAGPSMFDGFTSAQVYTKVGSGGTEASSAGLLR